MRTWSGSFTIDGTDESYVQFELARSPLGAALGVDPGEVTARMPRDPDRFESRVLQVLYGILSHRVGALVIGEIRRRRGNVFILPSSRTEESGAAPVGGGVGIGFRAGAAGMLSSPEVVLFHELVHALRAVAGARNLSSTHDAFENLEELYAILLENYFSAERGGRLRHAHSSRSAAYYPARNDPHQVPYLGLTFTTEVYTPAGNSFPEFTWAHRDELLAMRDPSSGFGPLFFAELGRLRTPFNPVRDVLRLEAQEQRDSLVPPQARPRGRRPVSGGAFRIPPLVF